MRYEEKIDLTSIIFSDECRFVEGDDRQWVWRRYGERNPTAYHRTNKFPRSIMIYGAIGLDYKSELVIVEGTIDSSKYQENILNSKMIDVLDSNRGKGTWIFQQDGARCHTSRESVTWLRSKCCLIQKWPANSPDLNTIENLWAIIKEAVYKLKPTSIEQLREVILNVWYSLDQSKINNLVLSFYQRLQLVIVNDGESIQPNLVRNFHQLNITITKYPANLPLWKDVISNHSFHPVLSYLQIEKKKQCNTI